MSARRAEGRKTRAPHPSEQVGRCARQAATSGGIPRHQSSKPRRVEVHALGRVRCAIPNPRLGEP